MGKAIVRVYRPELTDEERARRMAQLQEAAERFFTATLQMRKEKQA